MTLNWQITALLPLAYALLATLGCSESPPREIPAPAPNQSVAAPPADEPGAKTEEPPDDPPDTPAADAQRNLDDQITDYTPPFPDRMKLFVPPQRQGGGRLIGDESVELIGFARLHEPRALLSFNGEVSPLAEGAQLYGIEVISIQPPAVVLQRGRQRWQASLDN